MAEPTLRDAPSGVADDATKERAISTFRRQAADRGRTAGSLLHRDPVAAHRAEVPLAPLGDVGPGHHPRLLLRRHLQRLLRHERSDRAQHRHPAPAVGVQRQGRLVQPVRRGAQFPSGGLPGDQQARLRALQTRVRARGRVAATVAAVRARLSVQAVLLHRRRPAPARHRRPGRPLVPARHRPERPLPVLAHGARLHTVAVDRHHGDRHHLGAGHPDRFHRRLLRRRRRHRRQPLHRGADVGPVAAAVDRACRGAAAGLEHRAGLLLDHGGPVRSRLDRAGAHGPQQVPGAARGGVRAGGQAGTGRRSAASCCGTCCRRSPATWSSTLPTSSRR